MGGVENIEKIKTQYYNINTVFILLIFIFYHVIITIVKSCNINKKIK